MVNSCLLYEFEHSNEHKPGTWKPYMIDRRDNKRSALVTCPNCGTVVSLVHHTIHGNGEVFPSLVCPVDDCSFHEFIQLSGWHQV